MKCYVCAENSGRGKFELLEDMFPEIIELPDDADLDAEAEKFLQEFYRIYDGDTGTDEVTVTVIPVENSDLQKLNEKLAVISKREFGTNEIDGTDDSALDCDD